MASISKDPKGWRIRFLDQHGTRRTIRPGNVNKSTALQIAGHCETLVATQIANGIIPRQTAEWLGRIGNSLRDKLSRAGIVEPRLQSESATDSSETLLSFIDNFIRDRKTLDGRDASSSTRSKWTTARNHLEKFFPRGKRLCDVSPKDAENFRKYLESIRIKKTGLLMRENSKRKLIASTKVFFNKAVRLEQITRNPFAHEVSSSISIRDRDFFITAEMTKKLLAAAPDAQWRLMIALWRLAGLRKMEIHSLTWGDILKDEGRFRVRAPKTKHFKGRELRYVPLSSVLSYLEEARQVAISEGKSDPASDAAIITRYSPSNPNLHKPLLKIIEDAGLSRWPKLIQNLRASCETEWLDLAFPAHVVASWIGHSVRVQNESYAQVAQHHFDKFNQQHDKKWPT